MYGHDFKGVLQKCLCVHILAGSKQRRHWHIVPDAIYTRRNNDGCALYTGGLVLQMGHRSRQPHIHWELAPGITGNKLGSGINIYSVFSCLGGEVRLIPKTTEYQVFTYSTPSHSPWNFLLLLTKSLPRSSSGNGLFLQVWRNVAICCLSDSQCVQNEFDFQLISA